MEPNYRVLGTNIPRVDALLKATGKATYVNDIRLRGMLECKILKSPYAHARILSIDATRALNLPGVRGVLTYRDLPKLPISTPNSPHHTYRVLPEEVFFAGEQVAAVAAETKDVAMDALELIEVQYEILPSVFDPIESLKPGAPLMYPDLPNNVSPSNFPTETSRGDVETGFKEADVILESRYTVGVQAHNTMESHGTVCQWEGDNLTIWTSTKAIWAVLDIVCRIMGLPETRVEVNALYVGGDFGCKAGQTEAMQAVICATFAKRTGRPVRLQFTRDEGLVLPFHSVGPLYYDIKGGLMLDGGRPKAAEIVLHSNQGGHNVAGLEATYIGSGAVSVYRYENCKFTGFPMYCNLPMSGSRRGYGDPEGFWCSEQFVDELAEAAGWDPVEWRSRWAARKGDPTATRLIWGELSGGDYELLLRTGAEAFGWKDKWRGWGNPTEIKGPMRRGVGVALSQHITGSNSELGMVRINVDGSVDVFSHAEEVGQGIRTGMTMCIAEVLGVNPDHVRVTKASTAFVPRGYGVYASRGTPVIIGAAVKAAQDAKSQLLGRASRALNTRIEDLAMENGRIFVKSEPDKGVTIGGAATMFGRVGIIGMGYEEVPHYNPETKKPLWEKSNGALFTEIEVDTETGEVRVKKIVSVADAGVVIHPELAKAQVNCSIMWGLGYALYEDAVYDFRHQGRMMNVQMVDYKMPTFRDKQDFVSIVISDPSHAPTPPLHMKGLGEAAMVPVAPAIANAIRNAIGVRIKNHPITPGKILKALGKI
jgi:xanthine dehydrogenase molybdenum-binding subunit